jgi:AcrR family transcriptional regulator
MRVTDPFRLQRIIDTAAGLFAERPFHEVRMEDIAARSGVSKGLVYHHFKDKDDLYVALIVQGIRRLFHEVQARIENAESAEDKLRGFVEEGVRFLTSNPSYWALIQRVEQAGSPHADALQANRAEFFNLLTGIIQELGASGRWATGDPEVAAHALLGMIREICRWHPVPPIELSKHIVRLFLHGISNDRGDSSSERPPKAHPGLMS